MVLDPQKEDAARAIFVKWGLDFAVVGHTTDDLRFKVYLNGELKADLPIKELGDQAPEYDRPWVETPKSQRVAAENVELPCDTREALLALIGSPELSSRRWVWEQYDHIILGETVQKPGGDAAVIRVDGGPKGLALTADVTPRYCEADPFEGGKQAVAEAWRNLTAVGATPLAVTDNLNFGNPEKPEIMGQLVGCIKGIGEACRALDFPVVSGNVSLYNETQGRAILPTPTIGAVGVLADVAKSATIAFKREGEAILLIGDGKGWLGRSCWLWIVAGREEGAPPPVDLSTERRNGDFVRSMIQAGVATAVHDLSDGGLLLGVAEMALAGRIGARLDEPHGLAHGYFFGEDQARYLVTVPEGQAGMVIDAASDAGVTAARIGVTGGDRLIPGGEAPILLTELREAHEGWFPRFMAGPAIDADSAA